MGIWGRRDRRRSAGKGGTRSLWRIRWRGRGGTRSKGPRRDSILEKSSSRTWMQNSAGRPQEKDGEVHPGESRRTDRDTTPRNFLRRVRKLLGNNKEMSCRATPSRKTLGVSKERRAPPSIVFARVRNALKRKGVGPFVKDTVCAKSSEAIEKKRLSNPPSALARENRSEP